MPYPAIKKNTIQQGSLATVFAITRNSFGTVFDRPSVSLSLPILSLCLSFFLDLFGINLDTISSKLGVGWCMTLSCLPIVSSRVVYCIIQTRMGHYKSDPMLEIRFTPGWAEPMLLGSLWNHFGITLGKLWGNFGVNVRPIWCHLKPILQV